MFLPHSESLESRLQDTIMEHERWGHNVKMNTQDIIKVWKEYYKTVLKREEIPMVQSPEMCRWCGGGEGREETGGGGRKEEEKKKRRLDYNTLWTAHSKHSRFNLFSIPHTMFSQQRCQEFTNSTWQVIPNTVEDICLTHRDEGTMNLHNNDNHLCNN